jgi:predicted DNA-binding protein
MTGTARRDNPFSMRIPSELRDLLRATSDNRGICEGAYVRMLIEQHFGKRSRLPSAKQVMWHDLLKKIHEAIIELGDQIKARKRDDCDDPDQRSLDELVNLTTAVLRLEDAVRGQ